MSPGMVRRRRRRPGWRSSTVRPKRLATSSVAATAVRPRSSRKGLSSTTSTEPTRPEVAEHLHHQMRLAVGGAARHHGAGARRDRRVEEVDVEAHVQVDAARAPARRSARRAARRRRARRSGACRRCRCRAPSAGPSRPGRSSGRRRRAGSPAGTGSERQVAEQRRRLGSPARNESAMPCRLPEGLVRGCCSRHGRRARARRSRRPARRGRGRRR